MIVLDTNVVSELMRRVPDEGVVAWVDGQPASEVFLTAVTVAELLLGVALLPQGRRRSQLAEAVAAIVEMDFEDRVLAFDAIAAAHFADIVAQRQRIGRPISAADAQIAATCRSHTATLATRNTSDFDGVGVAVVNPWTSTV